MIIQGTRGYIIYSNDRLQHQEYSRVHRENFDSIIRRDATLRARRIEAPAHMNYG
jgi:hypothetical protein